MRGSNGSTFPATVPGCVHTDLIKNGQLPADIYWRDAAEQVQWIENEDWVYTRQFAVDVLAEGAALVFECLDTRRMQCTFGWDWTMRFVTCGIENQPCCI